MNKNRLSFYIAATLFLGVVAFIAVALISLVTVPDLDVSDGAYYGCIILAVGVAMLMGFHVGKAYQEMVQEEYDQECEQAYYDAMDKYYREKYNIPEDEESR